MSSRVAGRIGPTRPLVLNAGSRADCEPIEVANDVPPRLRTQRAGVVGTQHNGRRALEGQLLPPRGISASGSRLWGGWREVCKGTSATHRRSGFTFGI